MCRGYSDGKAWIQRRRAVELFQVCRRRYSIPVAIPGVFPLSLYPRKIRGRRYCDEKVATAKKHLDVAISMLIRGYCHVFAVAKLITCTSDV